MEFSYHGYINGLKIFYNSMRKLNVTIGTFDHNYNNINSSVIFDTRDQTGWKLIFMKKIHGAILSFPIQKGYKFTIEGNDAYKNLKSYFNIKGGKGEFKISEFIKHFDMQIPQTYTLDDKKRKTILKYDKIDESDGIYPIGTLNWEEINIKRLILGKKSKNRDPKNLDKTKNLYPRIYEATKDMNISIRYGSNKKKISPIFQDMLL